MTSSLLRVLQPACLLVGLLAGCAHSSQPTTEDVAPSSRPDGSTVTAEDLQRTPGQPIEKTLMDRFPGITVTRAPDGGIAVRIRGGSSIFGSNDPLYVVDGIPVQPGASGSLTGVNPYDIESIQVLKDPVDTAMYGFRGANGVIVIKTKRPGQ